MSAEDEDIEITPDSHVEEVVVPFSDIQEEELDDETVEVEQAELTAEEKRIIELEAELAKVKRQTEDKKEPDPDDPFSPQNNPMLSAAEKLPPFIQGADGAPNHIQDVSGDGEDPEVIDDSLGGGIGDPSTFTG